MPSRVDAETFARTYNIGNRIRQTIPTEMQDDVRVLTKLAGKASLDQFLSHWVVAIALMFCALMLSPIQYRHVSVGSLLLLGAAFLLTRRAYTRRAKARENMQRLVKDDPTRWGYIRRQIEQCVLEVYLECERQRLGSSTLQFTPRQREAILHREGLF
ncbi:MAG TPA: hypothetical protein VFX17_03840 [Patescibacteria group bacterium]|nr:hypothetical protein [Patescibacteria group bacterium]